MSQTNTNEPNDQRTHPFLSVFYVQAVCVAVILLSLLGLKFFFPALFSQVKERYEEHFLTETSIEQVFGDEGNDG